MISIVHTCDKCGQRRATPVTAGNHHIPTAPDGWRSWTPEQSSPRPTSRLKGFLLCGACVVSFETFVHEPEAAVA